MTPIHTTAQVARTTATTSAPRVSLTRERLHFLTAPAQGLRQEPRLRLTRGLVGRR